MNVLCYIYLYWILCDRETHAVIALLYSHPSSTPYDDNIALSSITRPPNTRPGEWRSGEMMSASSFQHHILISHSYIPKYARYNETKTRKGDSCMDGVTGTRRRRRRKASHATESHSSTTNAVHLMAQIPWSQSATSARQQYQQD